VNPWVPAPIQQGPVVNSIYDMSPSALGDLLAFIEQNPPKIPIDQVTGFTQITPYMASGVQLEEQSSSTVYTDLTTPGPSLSSLPDGTYMVLWGCTASSSSVSARAKMGVSTNGAAVDDTIAPGVATPNAAGMSYGVSLTLSAGGSNTITCKYRVTASATGTWGNRWLLAVRITGP